MHTECVFIIFFDYEQGVFAPDNSPSGIRIVRQVIDAWRAKGEPPISVVAYTDGTLSRQEAEFMAKRRAHDVAAALLRYSIPLDKMNIQSGGWYPGSQGGLRVAQNRRVEVLIPRGR